MNLGDQSAFPVPDSENLGAESGMTYRQWLVGMIACGGDCSPPRPDWIVKRADEIIAELEKEQHAKPSNT